MEFVNDMNEINKIGNGYNALSKAARDEYALDSNKVLLVLAVIDCSHSIFVNGKEIIINSIVPEFTREIRKDPEACANIRFAVIRYGTEVEVLSGFGSVYDYDESNDIYIDMALTDTAKALTKAYALTKDEMEYQAKQGKEVIPPIILHVTDGLQTSEKEEMSEMVSLYDNYHRKSGARKIKIYSITQDKTAADLVSTYSDQTFLAENYEKIGSAVTTMAKVGSVLSSTVLKMDPATGEKEPDFSNAPDIEIDDAITILPRKKMKITDIWES